MLPVSESDDCTLLPHMNRLSATVRAETCGAILTRSGHNYNA